MVDQSIVVLCCIVGAGVAVFMGWAISHRFYDVPTRNGIADTANEFSQAQYMREVRLRHHDDIAMAFGGQRALVGLLNEVNDFC